MNRMIRIDRHQLCLAALALASASGTVRGDTACASGSTAIPDGLGAATRSIVVGPAGPAVIVSIAVDVQVTHPWVGDLRLVLSGPSGASIVLLDRPGFPSIGFPGPWGCGGHDIDATFVDGATQAAESMCSTTAVPVIAGAVAPLEPLDAFIGTSPTGTWTISAADLASIDAGILGEVCLVLDTAPDCNLNGIPDQSDIASGNSLDANGDGVPDECACPGDLNGSGNVNGADLAIVLGSWGACGGCPGDTNSDGVVDAADIAVVLGGWGLCGG